MALSQPKKVNYSPNQRLDLADKIAEQTTQDDNDNQWRLATLANDPDGRVLSGWRTTTVNGANSGFSIAAEPAAALDRAGNLLILDGSASLTVTLTQNTINYIHAYYAETPTDPDTRRFFSSGSEVLLTTNTRLTRTPNLYRTTAAYGGGTPAYSGFSATATIAGNTVQLLPLYAVAVDNTNTITSVVDFRPMFALAAGTAGNNQYEATSGHADLPFNFAPSTNAATLGITSIRQALAALADRIQQIKGTTNWYDNAPNQWTYSSGSGSLSSPALQINVNGNMQFNNSARRISFYDTINTSTSSAPVVYGSMRWVPNGVATGSYLNSLNFGLYDDLRNEAFLSYTGGSALTIGTPDALTLFNSSFVRVTNGLYAQSTFSCTGNATFQGNVSASAPSNFVLTASGNLNSSAPAIRAVMVGAASYQFNSDGSVFMGPNAAAVIPVVVPAGAVVSQVFLWYAVTTAGGNISAQAFRGSGSALSPQAGASASVAATVTSGAYVSMTGSLTIGVNQTLFVYVSCDSGVASGSSAPRIWSVEVTYTLPSMPAQFGG